MAAVFLSSPGPVNHLVAVTKSNTTVYSPPLTKLYVGGTGDVALLASGDTVAQTIAGVAAGVWIVDVAIQKVMSTGTTATELIGGYN